MKKLLKILGMALLAILAIPVVFYAFLFLYNLRDDALDPEVERLLAAAPPQIAATDNGYFAWIGIVGPEDQDPHAWGQRWFQQALAADKAPPGAGGELAINAEKRRETLQSKDIPCLKVDSCLEAVSARPEAARAALEQGRVTLARGDAAVAYPAYQEAWRPDFSIASPLPSYAHQWRHLSATRFALAVAEGRHEEALDGLGREMAFHTRQLQGANTLIEKMVALASLRNDYQLLSQYLARQPDAARPRAERVAALLAPLPPESTRLQASILSELRTGCRLMLSLKDTTGMTAVFGTGTGDEPDLAGRLVDKLGGSLLLPKATVNETFGLNRPWLAADGLDGAGYRAALAKAREEAQAAAQETFRLRNPIGHILNAVAAPGYERYFLKRDDLLALRAATALQLDLLRRGAGEPDAATLAAAALAHPYTGEAPVWDKARRTLSYGPVLERDGKPLLLTF